MISVLVVVLAGIAAGVVVSSRGEGAVQSDVITRPAPELGPQAHLLLPNLRDATMVVPDRPHDPQEVRAPDRAERITRLRTFSVSTNSRGFRGPEVSVPAEGPRVLCVGDSVTFGWGVSEPESYPARLRSLLSVDVVNAGVPALKPDHMGAWIEQNASALDIDALIFTARPNHTRPDPYGEYARALATAVRTVAPAKVGVVLPPLSTFDVMGTRGQRDELAKVREIARTVPGGPVPVLELTDAFRAALPRPGVVLEQQGRRQKMVRLPDRTVLVDAAAPQRGLAPEIVAAFEADDSVAEPLFFDGGHPDAAGFEVFSAAVATWAQQNLL